jgi:hypothetical protein
LNKRKLLGDERNRSAAARKRLGVTSEDMEGQRTITHILEAAPGGLQACLQALRGDDSEAALAFLAKYDSVPKSDLPRLRIEEISIAAGVPPKTLVATVVAALIDQVSAVERIMVLVAKPKIMRKTLEMAEAGNIPSMEIVHRATGFLPTPKGSVFNFFPPSKPKEDEDDGESGEEHSPGSMDDFLLEMNDVVRTSPRLEAPKSEIPVNAPDIEFLEIDV